MHKKNKYDTISCLVSQVHTVFPVVSVNTNNLIIMARDWRASRANKPLVVSYTWCHWCSIHRPVVMFRQFLRYILSSKIEKYLGTQFISIGRIRVIDLFPNWLTPLQALAGTKGCPYSRVNHHVLLVSIFRWGGNGVGSLYFCHLLVQLTLYCDTNWSSGSENLVWKKMMEVRDMTRTQWGTGSEKLGMNWERQGQLWSVWQHLLAELKDFHANAALRSPSARLWELIL